ncbi:Hypothetical predicted protein [Pelobates cultripes]|uniref:Uncharacterized protein n=1 Tax=Pelobates cultripes TaxID=61616 RepID=A0AAD1TMH3_PELCU|nr:Hypothetical predicted protein [Pelobates cultripes]
MLTRAHSEVLIQEFCPAMREELAGLRSDLTTLDTRVEASVAQICQQRHRATEIAATHQGNMLLTLRRQVEDLENRSRHQNIRVRGLPEHDTTPVVTTLEALFQQILGPTAPAEMKFDWAHGPNSPRWQSQRCTMLPP